MPDPSGPSTRPPSRPSADAERDLLPGPLVSADWLLAHLGSVDIVDVRWSMADGPKRSDHETAHLPGAVFADLDADLSDPPGQRGRHPLPSPEAFAQARSRLGLTGRPVVAYDDQRGATAARLWWMLDAIGCPAAVLDGGVEAWPGPWESGPTPAPAMAEAVEVAPVDWPDDRFIDAADVLAAIGAGAVLLDARASERFEGRPNPIDDPPGHIPGSRSRPWTDNVGDDGRLLPADRLRDELGGLGVSQGRELIASCGSGVTGCHDLLAARVAGFDGGRLYTGSWSEWSRGPDRPVATGP